MRADLQNAKKTSESGNITKPGYSVTHGIQCFAVAQRTTTLKGIERLEYQGLLPDKASGPNSSIKSLRYAA
jgi:hypothetical protein